MTIRLGHPVRHVTASSAAGIRPVLRSPRALKYRIPPSAATDLPPHVRAASALRRHGDRLIVLQDDVNALAVLDVDGVVEPLLLPPGSDGRRRFDDGRGNKRLKLDLEAGAVLPDGRFVAFGSGSSRHRERLAVLTGHSDLRLHPAPELYAALRTCVALLGVELNLEGAVTIGDHWLRLLQRGNKAGAEPGSVGNAIIDLELAAFVRWLDARAPLPPIATMLAVDLGAVQGVPYGFTDATVCDDGSLAFLACAEDSADVRSDGPVLGCRFGWLRADDVCVTDVLEPDGRRTTLKLEGIEARPHHSRIFDVVADMDRPDEPATLLELILED
jgi:hypothetical protein